MTTTGDTTATRPAAPPSPSQTAPVRRRLLVRGAVQGVGFRPFLHALAADLDLAGHVANNPAGVVAEVEGGPRAVEEFCAGVTERPPPLAVVTSVVHEELPAQGTTGFTILPSAPGEGRTRVPPDTATCADCLADMAGPGNRRHRHPFVTCTHCGPRFTIVTALPYDRANTTMAGFPMCDSCAAEYAAPADRRFHAQPVACPSCGPRLYLTRAQHGDEPAEGSDEDAVAGARRLLARGAILAVKGLGGYHLACDAGNEHAVAALRARKQRGGKPFAVMAADAGTAAGLARLTPAGHALLTSRRRPVVLLRRGGAGTAGGLLADAVCPGSPDIGVMLPYTPVHHLLFGLDGDPPGPRVLVMTSGNHSGEPIVTDDSEARERLAGLADAWLWHDRPIRVPCDDSVTAVRADSSPLPLRRSRGHAPEPLALPAAVRPALAVGGDLKNTFCLADGTTAWPSAHIGDMDHPATLTTFTSAVRHLEQLTGVRPEILAADRHPGYRSAGWARRHAAGRTLRLVQHHHAHIASCMADNGHDGTAPVIGVAFDGTGYGDDAAVWGGEVMLADYAGYRRLAHLRYVPLPGGDTAVRRPYRMALAHLRAAGLAWDDRLPCAAACGQEERGVLDVQLRRGLACVPTSSMGRLFDAVSSLCGVCHESGYEAQAAIELEAAAVRAMADCSPAYAFGTLPAPRGGAPALLDPAPVLRSAVADLLAGTPVPVIAARFHHAVAGAVRTACHAARKHTGADTVALTGGVFSNTLLDEGCARQLAADGFTVLRHRSVPPGDGGLALGQLMVAARTPA